MDDGTVPGAALPGSGAPSVAPTAGTNYETYSQVDIQPTDLDGGRRLSNLGAYPAHLDTYMVVPVHLPMNTVIREFQVVAYNASGSSQLVRFERFSLYSNSATQLTSLAVPSGAGLQTLSTSYYHVVSAEYTYNLAFFGYTTGTVRFYSARLGFGGPFGFHPFNPPFRKMDTRNSGFPYSGKILATGTKSVTLSPTVPSLAASLLLNLTVTDTEGSGWVAVYPLGGSWPGTSNINWSGPGQTIANSVTVPAGDLAGITLLCGGTGAKAHVIVDVAGYYQ